MKSPGKETLLVESPLLLSRELAGGGFSSVSTSSGIMGAEFERFMFNSAGSLPNAGLKGTVLLNSC